jgi:hypothetical protein
VTDDGGQEARRRSGERWWSEQAKTSEMCVCKHKSECARSSTRCSGSGIRRGHARARAAMPAARVAARRSSGSGRDIVSCVEEGSGD